MSLVLPKIIVNRTVSNLIFKFAFLCLQSLCLMVKWTIPKYIFTFSMVICVFTVVEEATFRDTALIANCASVGLVEKSVYLVNSATPEIGCYNYVIRIKDVTEGKTIKYPKNQ